MKSSSQKACQSRVKISEIFCIFLQAQVRNSLVSHGKLFSKVLDYLFGLIFPLSNFLLFFPKLVAMKLALYFSSFPQFMPYPVWKLKDKQDKYNKLKEVMKLQGTTKTQLPLSLFIESAAAIEQGCHLSVIQLSKNRKFKEEHKCPF